MRHPPTSLLTLLSLLLVAGACTDQPPTEPTAVEEPATGPSARAYHAMAYDAQSDRVILFGGAIVITDLAVRCRRQFQTDRPDGVAPVDL